MQFFKRVSVLVNPLSGIMILSNLYCRLQDPFATAVQLKQQAPLMLFEEHPTMKNTHWLTDIPVTSCRAHKVGETQVLCSGSVMGSRGGILDYIKVMVVRSMRSLWAWLFDWSAVTKLAHFYSSAAGGVRLLEDKKWMPSWYAWRCELVLLGIR